MTRQTVYLNNIARKSGCRLHYLRQSAFLNSPLLERSDELSNEQCDKTAESFTLCKFSSCQRDILPYCLDGRYTK